MGMMQAQKAMNSPPLIIGQKSKSPFLNSDRINPMKSPSPPAGNTGTEMQTQTDMGDNLPFKVYESKKSFAGQVYLKDTLGTLKSYNTTTNPPTKSDQDVRVEQQTLTPVNLVETTDSKIEEKREKRKSAKQRHFQDTGVGSNLAISISN